MVPLRYASFVSEIKPYGFYEVLWKEGSPQPPPSLGLLRLRYIFSKSPDGFEVHRTGLKELPRFFAAPQWKVLKQEEVIPATLQPRFDPTGEALLESDPGIPQENGTLKSKIQWQDLSTDRILLDATLSQPAVLVETDNYSHGWKARELGPNPMSIPLPAYGFLRAIPLRRGEHHILLEYRPIAFVVGQWISLFSGLTFLLFLFWNRKTIFLNP